MPRIAHGGVVTETDLQNAAQNDDALPGVAAPNLRRFDYLFQGLQANPGALLPDSADNTAVIKALGRLGRSMVDDSGNDVANTAIPAAYTYFGQFVDHDITLEVAEGAAAGNDRFGDILDENFRPLSQVQASSLVKNKRTASFDLDSVYGDDANPVPRDGTNPHKLLIGDVSDIADNSKAPRLPVPGKGLDNDVPREGRNADAAHDRAALIGDPRNDENTIISQLQVAFLKAHNRLVDLGYNFEQARHILRQHYQHIVINDFLDRIADPTIVANIRTNGNQWYDAFSESFFLPLEFSFAAYRFGHTMVRAQYDFNLNFNLSGIPGTTPASLDLLFTFTALSGQLRNFDTLPENWVIEWENIIGTPGDGGKARKFDTRLSALNQALFRLKQVDGTDEQFAGTDLAGILSARNLLRSYRMRIPTGQAVAGTLGLPVLTEAQLTADAASDEQRNALVDGGFHKQTPLWYYVLAEASILGNGEHLGPVGSTLVAEVLVGLVRRSEDSILRIPGWQVALPSAQDGRFELADLLRFAGVLGDPPAVQTYVVVSGDTLFGIAKKKLGSGERWPEIFAANRTVIRRYDQIFPGMRLILPGGPAPEAQLRFIIVEPGDTLSELAQKHLGDGDRWPEILTLNGGIITNPNVIIVGQVLQLPQ